MRWSTRIIGEKETTEWRYFIISLPTDAAMPTLRFADATYRCNPAAQGDRRDSRLPQQEGRAALKGARTSQQLRQSKPWSCLDPGIALGHGWSVTPENLISEPDTPEYLNRRSPGAHR